MRAEGSVRTRLLGAVVFAAGASCSLPPFNYQALDAGRDAGDLAADDASMPDDARADLPLQTDAGMDGPDDTPGDTAQFDSPTPDAGMVAPNDGPADATQVDTIMIDTQPDGPGDAPDAAGDDHLDVLQEGADASDATPTDVGGALDVGRCPSGMTPCGEDVATACTDLQSDPLNCGACGNRCATDRACVSGICRGGASAPCEPGVSLCRVEFTCGTFSGMRYCERSCMPGASESEQMQCGGSNATCISIMVDSVLTGRCAKACAAGTGECRAGTICTSFAYAGLRDAPGCMPFCRTNAHCPGGTFCNPRRGTCLSTPENTAAAPDGSPCTSASQCRGTCTAIDRPRGICTSFINRALSESCPDGGGYITLGALDRDDLTICAFRTCTRDSQCGPGLICIYEEVGGTPQMSGFRRCTYPTAAQPTGIP